MCKTLGKSAQYRLDCLKGNRGDTDNPNIGSAQFAPKPLSEIPSNSGHMTTTWFQKLIFSFLTKAKENCRLYTPMRHAVCLLKKLVLDLPSTPTKRCPWLFSTINGLRRMWSRSLYRLNTPGTAVRIFWVL